jgi:antitoxin YefM
MAKILPISEVKAKLPELVNRVEELEEEIIVTRNGKPAAMLVSYADYERLKETLDVLSDPDLMRQIRLSEADIAAGKPGLSIDEVFGQAPRRRKRNKRR